MQLGSAAAALGKHGPAAGRCGRDVGAAYGLDPREGNLACHRVAAHAAQPPRGPRGCCDDSALDSYMQEGQCGVSKRAYLCVREATVTRDCAVYYVSRHNLLNLLEVQ